MFSAKRRLTRREDNDEDTDRRSGLGDRSIGSRAAQKIELAGRVRANSLGPQRAPLGDPNIVALSRLNYDVHGDVVIEILDIAGAKVWTLNLKRATVLKSFGRMDPTLGWKVMPDGELVSLRGSVAGLLLRDSGTGANRHWYVEADAVTGALGKSALLGTLAADDNMTFLGTDGAKGAAWFAVRRKSSTAIAVDFQRIDLATLAVTTPHKLTMVPKAVKTGYEDHLMFHAAGDFSRFAVVEYDEAGLGTAPPAMVHFVDASGSFTVPAMSTTYGVAFSPDGAHAYLGSSQLGTVQRVDLAARRVDATTTGPRLLGHLMLTPKGQLIAMATATRYAVYDPGLKTRTDRAHVADLAPAFGELFGAAATTSDGRHIVLVEANPLASTLPFQPPGRDYLIAKIVE
jgi:hypothetical protein